MATVIIILVIIGFITISNYSRRKTSTKLYDLGEELGIESQNVLDYGTYLYSIDKTIGVDFFLEQFIETYVDYAGADKNLYFLFGDHTSIKVKTYQEIEEIVSVDGQNIMMTDGEGEKSYTPSESKIAIIINDTEYHFKLNKGENFYFVISQEIEGERYVITG